MGISVQFRGKDQVLEAFENRAAESFTIWQGRQYMFKGQGADQLDKILDMLDSSDAIYRIQVYDEVTDLAKLKDKTQHDGSFNFKLTSEDAPRMGRVPGSGGYSDIDERLKRIEAAILGGVDDGEEEEEEEKTIGSLVMDYLKDPAKAIDLVNVAKAIFSPAAATAAAPLQVPAPYQQQSAAATMGNSEPLASEVLEKRLDRLSAAIDILDSKDPSLIDHLEKLAEIATNKPDAFNMLLSMLEKF